MKFRPAFARLLAPAVLCWLAGPFVAAVVAPPTAMAHGAVVPVTPSQPGPPGGGSGGGQSGGNGPQSNGPSGPATSGPGPSGPTSVTPGGTGPKTGGGPGTSGPGGSTGAFNAQDALDWQLWWTFHRDEFIELKASLARNATPMTGDELLLGSTRVAQPPAERQIHELVVPALIRALDGERNQDVLSSSILALAKIGRSASPADAPAIEAALKPFLADSLQEVAETAALGLGLNATRGAAQLLVDLAQDSERGRASVGQSEVAYRTRAFACYGLGLLARDAENPDVRRFVALHLISIFEADKSATRDVRTAALLALSLIPLEPARSAEAPESGSADATLAWLLRVWNDRTISDLVRCYAAPSAARLASRGSRASADLWKSALCDALKPGALTQASMQQSAVIALGLLTDNDGDELDERARQTLATVSQDGESLAKRFAYLSLARAGSHDGAGEGTHENRAAVREFLLGELRGGSALRPWVALALGVHEALAIRAGHDASPEAHAALLKGLHERKSPNELGAWCIANALALQQEAREPLLEIVLDNSETPARSHAALALGLLRWDGAVIGLRKVLPDARYKPYLLRDIAISLGLLGSQEIVPELLRMLDDTASLASMSAVASGLGYVGDARAIDPLVAMVKKGDRPDRVRAFAAAALGGLCDRDPRPWNAEIACAANYWLTPATLFEPGGATGILDLL